QGDQTQTPRDPISGHGGPTLRDSEWNVRAWNTQGALARAAGIDGRAVSDYLGAQDTANATDGVFTIPSAVERFVMTSAGGLDAIVGANGGSQYYLVTANDGCTEGPSGSDSFGVLQPGALLDCVP